MVPSRFAVGGDRAALVAVDHIFAVSAAHHVVGLAVAHLDVVVSGPSPHDVFSPPGLPEADGEEAVGRVAVEAVFAVTRMGEHVTCYPVRGGSGRRRRPGP